MVCSKTSVFLSLTTASTRNPPYACRGESVTFHCEVVNGASLQWVSEPDICRNLPVSFTSSDNEGEEITRDFHTYMYHSRLLSLAQNPPTSNFSSVLTFTPNTSITVICGDQLSSCGRTENESTLPITGKCMLINYC